MVIEDLNVLDYVASGLSDHLQSIVALVLQAMLLA